jgi:hypothetical protein
VCINTSDNQNSTTVWDLKLSTLKPGDLTRFLSWLKAKIHLDLSHFLQITCTKVAWIIWRKSHTLHLNTDNVRHCRVFISLTIMSNIADSFATRSRHGPIDRHVLPVIKESFYKCKSEIVCTLCRSRWERAWGQRHEAERYKLIHVSYSSTNHSPTYTWQTEWTTHKAAATKQYYPTVRDRFL